MHTSAMSNHKVFCVKCFPPTSAQADTSKFVKGIQNYSHLKEEEVRTIEHIKTKLLSLKHT